jgi:hypothetical protein
VSPGEEACERGQVFLREVENRILERAIAPARLSSVGSSSNSRSAIFAWSATVDTLRSLALELICHRDSCVVQPREVVHLFHVRPTFYRTVTGGNTPRTV